MKVRKKCFGHQYDYPLRNCKNCDEATFDECAQKTVELEINHDSFCDVLHNAINNAIKAK
jgi:signal transduction histidine kinase